MELRAATSRVTELLGRETARFPLGHTPLHWRFSSVQPCSVQLAKGGSCSVHSRFSLDQFCPSRFRPSSVQPSSLHFVSLHFRSLHFASPQFRFLFQVSSVRFSQVQFSSFVTSRAVAVHFSGGEGSVLFVSFPPQFSSVRSASFHFKVPKVKLKL